MDMTFPLNCYSESGSQTMDHKNDGRRYVKMPNVNGIAYKALIICKTLAMNRPLESRTRTVKVHLSST